jgi:hypothetical protein
MSIRVTYSPVDSMEIPKACCPFPLNALSVQSPISGLWEGAGGLLRGDYVCIYRREPYSTGSVEPVGDEVAEKLENPSRTPSPVAVAGSIQLPYL